MKINFRKITAIGASLLMAGMTAGIAAAANFPAPFVQNSVADVAVVYGTGAGVSSLDLVQAGQIQTKLGESMPSTGGSTATGGDSVLLERSTDKLNLGDSAATTFVTSITSDNLPTLLADGTYTDHVNTEYDYTQKITLGANLLLSHFSDTDYKDKTPTIGVKLNDDAHVLNYTFDLATNPAFNATTMEYTTLKMMGKDYYVLDVKGVGDTSGATLVTDATNTMTLLDSANSAIVTEGETATLGGKTVSIEYIGSTEVKLSINGEVTNSLAEGGTYKLSDGSYVGIKDIMYVSKDTGVSKVEVVIGNGKLKLINGQDVQLNDNTLNGVVGFLQQDATYKLDKIVLQWTTDDKAFVTKDSSLEIPGFKSIKFSFADFVIPKEEVTKFENNGNSVIELTTTLKDGEVTIPLLEATSTGTFELIGKDSSNRLATGNGSAYVFFNETAGDKYIVASWNSTTEAESYYLKVNIELDGSSNPILKLTNEGIPGSNARELTNGSSLSFGSVTLYADNITKDGSKKWANISYIGAGGSFNTLYTKEGLKIYLPYVTNGTCTAEGAICSIGTSGSGFGHYSNITWNGTVGHGNTTYYQYFTEEDKDGNLAAGKQFNATVGEAGTSDKVAVTAIGVNYDADSGYEIGDTNNYENYVTSALATKTMYYTGGDQDTVDITYHGTQAYGKLYLTAPETVVGGGSTLGDVLVKDSEVSSVSGKNLIVVGGSCINAAAASVLGSAYCGPAFTTNTKVGAGQFLISAVASPYNSAKVALLVAGYEAADTVNAATYLRTQTVDTTVGKKYIGTSATSAELQVA